MAQCCCQVRRQVHFPHTMEYGARPGSERFLRRAAQAMAGSLVLFVGMNAYSLYFDARVTRDPEVLRQGIDARIASRRASENAVLLRQRERWLAMQAEPAEPAPSTPEEAR